MTQLSIQRIARRLLLAAALAASAFAWAGPEEDFVAARDAFRAGDARRLDLYASRLKNYVLEPYVSYWQLRMRLQEADPAEVRRFLAVYADAPVSKYLLADWLRLTGSSQRWDLFDAEFGQYTGDDL